MEAKNAVCYIVSGNYTKQLSVSLLSLVKSYLSDVALDVYVFNEQVAAEDLLVLEKLPAMVGKPQIHVKSHSLVELPAELIEKVKEHVNPLYLQRLFLRLCPKLCVHHFQRILRNQRDFLRILFLWLEVQPKNDAFLHVGEIGHAKTKASK